MNNRLSVFVKSTVFIDPATAVFMKSTVFAKTRFRYRPVLYFVHLRRIASYFAKTGRRRRLCWKNTLPSTEQKGEMMIYTVRLPPRHCGIRNRPGWLMTSQNYSACRIARDVRILYDDSFYPSVFSFFTAYFERKNNDFFLYPHHNAKKITVIFCLPVSVSIDRRRKCPGQFKLSRPSSRIRRVKPSIRVRWIASPCGFAMTEWSYRYRHGEGRSAIQSTRMDCFILRDDGSVLLLSSWRGAKLSSVLAWIASPCGFAMTGRSYSYRHGEGRSHPVYPHGLLHPAGSQ
jgi:hypothetical protein